MADAAHKRTTPSPWVTRFAPLIRAGGSVLDLACGSGRHANWLTSRGYQVVAVDRDADVLQSVSARERLVVDLEDGSWPLGLRRFDGIVVINYLHRPLFSNLCAALAPGGVLIYETFSVEQKTLGRPTNPDFLLRTGELLEHCARLRVVAFEDGYVAELPAYMQRICAVASVGRSEQARWTL